MRTAKKTLDDHMLYTSFVLALPAEYEVEPRNLASRDVIGRDDIIKAVRERHHRLFRGSKKGSNAGHVGHVMFAVVAEMVAKEQGPAAVPTGMWRPRKNEKVDVGGGKDVVAPTRTAVARPRLPVVMATAQKPPKVVRSRLDATDVARRVIGGSTARRRYAANATDGGTLLMSAPRRKRKLCWRRRTTIMMMIRLRLQISGPERQASAVMFWAEREKGSRPGR